MEDSTFSSPVEWVKAQYDEILKNEIEEFLRSATPPKQRLDYLSTMTKEELLKEAKRLRKEAKRLRDENVTLKNKNLELQALVKEKYDERA